MFCIITLYIFALGGIKLKNVPESEFDWSGDALDSLDDFDAKIDGLLDGLYDYDHIPVDTPFVDAYEECALLLLRMAVVEHDSDPALTTSKGTLEILGRILDDTREPVLAAERKTLSRALKKLFVLIQG